MPLTPEQRAENSRNNGRKSKGPTSKEGLQTASMNAYKHGLTARTILPMPGEDPEVIADRTAFWHGYYQPISPAAVHLVNQCAHATLMADRCQRHHDQAVARQVQKADDDWVQTRCKSVMHHIHRFLHDPKTHLPELAATAHGCGWILSRLVPLQEALETHGYWGTFQLDEAIRLVGADPEAERFDEAPRAYLLTVYNLLAPPLPSVDEAIRRTTGNEVPYSLRLVDRKSWLLEPRFCSQALKDHVAAEIAYYTAREEQLRTEEDEPERASVRDRALMLQDEKEARLYFRYHGEARSTFHRGVKELEAVLERDKKANNEADSGGEDAGSEPTLEPSRNEPTVGLKLVSYSEVMADENGPEVAGPAVAESAAAAVVEPTGEIARNEPTEGAEIVSDWDVMVTPIEIESVEKSTATAVVEPIAVISRNEPLRFVAFS